MHIAENRIEPDREFPTEADDQSEQLTDKEKIQKEKDRLYEIEADLKKNGGMS